MNGEVVEAGATRVAPQGEDELILGAPAPDSCALGEVVDDDDGEETTIEEDMTEAITLLRQSKMYMACIADPELTPKIVRNHRESLERLVEKIEKFLDEVEESYGDIE